MRSASSQETRVVDRLASAGHDLPAASPASYSYRTVVEAGPLAFVSGQIAKVDGEVWSPGVVGLDRTVDEGVRAARICALNALAQLNEHVGLERVNRIAKLNVFVASGPDFIGQPLVAEGASQLFDLAFGPEGGHARTALGVPRLPADSMVEIEVVALLTA